MNEYSKLRWQCRRGMRELDILLTRYLEQHYRTADARQKAAFEALLTLSDPQLAGYLLRGEKHPEPTTTDVINRILGQDHAG